MVSPLPKPPQTHKKSRFILNLPRSEYEVDRFFFNMQKAYWFYIDLMLEESYRRIDLKNFAKILYNNIPMAYQIDTFQKYYSTFSRYIQQIPVYGAIILNSTLDKVLLGKPQK